MKNTCFYEVCKYLFVNSIENYEISESSEDIFGDDEFKEETVNEDEEAEKDEDGDQKKDKNYCLSLTYF